MAALDGKPLEELDKAVHEVALRHDEIDREAESKLCVQAIEDLRCGSNRRREDAIHWIEEDSETQFSFVFCCRILQRDPEEVRRFLLQREFPNWLFAALVQKSETASA